MGGGMGMGGMPPGGPDTGMGGMGGGAPMFPTADPQAMSQILSQILQAQAADQQHLSQMQHEAIAGNPLFQALMGQAPMPGAGADGAVETGATQGLDDPGMNEMAAQ